LARLLALDYGIVRTGIAVTDEMQLIAFGLTTVETSGLFSFLKTYLADENVELIVLGEPKQMNGSASESEILIQKFLEKFKQQFPDMPIVRQDERFTSKMAFQTMLDSGIGKKKRQNKALIDQVSATIILQSYLEKK
jgi:putative Holliday junction resolvase